MQTKTLLRDYQNISKEVWDLFLSRVDTTTDAEWIKYLRETDDLTKKYKDSPAYGYAERYAYLMFNEVGEIVRRKNRDMP